MSIIVFIIFIFHFFCRTQVVAAAPVVQKTVVASAPVYQKTVSYQPAPVAYQYSAPAAVVATAHVPAVSATVHIPSVSVTKVVGK